eukprot:PhM_4_TR18749/c0_g1_i1/m.1534
MDFSSAGSIELGDEVRAFSVLNNIAWTGHSDGSVTLRDATTTNPKFTIERYDKEFVWAMTAETSTKKVWIGYSSGTVRVYDELTVLVAEMREHRSGINAMCCCHHTASVFTGSNDTTILEWCSSKYTRLRKFDQKHNAAVRCLHVGLSVGPSDAIGALLFSGSSDRTVRMWSQSHNGTELTAHGGSVLCLTMSEHNLWSGGEEGEIRVTDVRSPHKSIATLQSAHDRSVTVLCAVPGTKFIMSGAVDRTVVLWDATALAPVKSFPNSHRGYIHAIGTAYEDIERSVVMWSCAANDPTVKKWRLKLSAAASGQYNNNGCEEAIRVTSSASPSRCGSGSRHTTPPRAHHHHNPTTHLHHPTQSIAELQETVDAHKKEIWTLRKREEQFKAKLTNVQSAIETAQRNADMMRQKYNSQISKLSDTIERTDERLHRVKQAEKKVRDLLRSVTATPDADPYVKYSLEHVLELLSAEPGAGYQSAVGDLKSAKLLPSSRNVSPARQAGVRAPTPNYRTSPTAPRPMSPRYRHTDKMVPISPSARTEAIAAASRIRRMSEQKQSSPEPSLMNVPKVTRHVSPERQTTTKITTVPAPAPAPSPMPAPTPWTAPARSSVVPPLPSPPQSSTEQIGERKEQSNSPPPQPSTLTPRQTTTGGTLSSASADRLAEIKARIRGGGGVATESSHNPQHNASPTTSTLPNNNSNNSGESLDRVQMEYQRILAQLDALE